jgi:hypothetical protein
MSTAANAASEMKITGRVNPPDSSASHRGWRFVTPMIVALYRQWAVIDG